MLPSFLQASYKQYKTDSDFVANWLVRSAQRCGYSKDLLINQSEPPAKAPKLKGRARKLARDAAAQNSKAGKNGGQAIEITPKPSKHLIAVGEFIVLAELIAKATKPIVEVPLSFVNVLDRAIAVRKRHHSWWAQPGNNHHVDAHQKEEANQKHQFFIGVLERVREILRPRMSAESSSDVPDVGSPESLPNLFSGLKVEDPPEAYHAAPDTQPDLLSSAAAAAAASQPQDEYGLKREDDIEEVYFAVHCLFNDLDNIRRYLSRVWKGYKDGIVDIIAASITTNTAIEFARRLQEDYVETFPRHTDFELHINVLYAQQCLARGEDPTFKERPDDEMNFNIYNQVEPLMFPTYMLLSSFTDVIEPGSLPMSKLGHFGTYEPTTNRERKSARDKFREDKIVLLEILPDFCVLAYHDGPVFAEDEFTRGVRELAKTKEVQIWLVFAAQIFLDIHHVLRDRVVDGFTGLVKSAKYVEGNVNQILKFHEHLRIDNWPRSNDQGLLQLLDCISDWIKTDKVSKMRSWLTRDSPFQLPPDESFLLLKQHPLYCGLLSYSIKTLATDASVIFVNAWGSTLYCAHLYNALRQEKLLSDVWQDMNLVLHMHDTSRMFVGDFPQNCEDYFKRFCLAMGYSVTNFAKNRRSARPAASKAGPRVLNDLAPVSNKFKLRFCSGDERAGLLPADVEYLLEEYDDEIIDVGIEDGSDEWQSPHNTVDAEESAISILRKKISRSVASGVKPVLILNNLLQAIQSEIPELTFNHFRLHISCWIFLRHLQKSLDSELREIYGPGYLEKENQLPWVVGYILMTASQTSKLAGVLVPKKKDIVTSRLLTKAAQSMKAMTETSAGGVEIAMLEKQIGAAVNMKDIYQSS